MQKSDNAKKGGSVFRNMSVEGSLTAKKEVPKPQIQKPDNMSQKDFDEILRKQEENHERAQKIKAQTQVYENSTNKWRVIAHARNDYMATSEKTLAMELKDGVLIQCLHNTGNKSSMALQFIPGLKIIKEDEFDVYTIVNR